MSESQMILGFLFSSLWERGFALVFVLVCCLEFVLGFALDFALVSAPEFVLWCLSM